MTEHVDKFEYKVQDGYELYNYDDYATPLREIVRQYLAGEPLVWTGPDRTHYAIAASTPSPSWFFSEEGRVYEEERGRDFWDTLIQVASMLGFHNGTMKQLEQTEHWKRMAEANLYDRQG